MNRNSITRDLLSHSLSTRLILLQTEKLSSPRARSGKVGKKTIYTLRWVLLRFLPRKLLFVIVIVGWALPTINAVTLRARGANHLSQTDRNGGQGISIALLIQSFDPTLQLPPNA